MSESKIISPIRTAITLKCPKCGKGKIYRKFLAIADKCSDCGLNLQEHDAADGPAYVSMSFTGAIVTAMVLFTELMYSPPLWVHAMLWIPFIVICSVVLLIYTKALFMALHYKYIMKQND